MSARSPRACRCAMKTTPSSTKTSPGRLRASRSWARASGRYIHAPEGGFGIDEEGQYHAVPGAIVPREYIGGTVGAGDAFTAGVLLGAHRDSTLEEALTYATASAVASLRKSDASEGVLPLEECLKLLAGFPPRTAALRAAKGKEKAPFGFAPDGALLLAGRRAWAVAGGAGSGVRYALLLSCGRAKAPFGVLSRALLLAGAAGVGAGGALSAL